MYDLLDITKYTHSVGLFVERGDLAKALETIGGNELDAAIYTLNNLSSHYDTYTATMRVIGHLESAIRAFGKQANVNENLTINMMRNHYLGTHKCYWSSCLTAMCHSYCGDDGKVIKDYLWLSSQAAAVLMQSDSIGPWYKNYISQENIDSSIIRLARGFQCDGSFSGLATTIGNAILSGATGKGFVDMISLSGKNAPMVMEKSTFIRFYESLVNA